MDSGESGQDPKVTGRSLYRSIPIAPARAPSRAIHGVWGVHFSGRLFTLTTSLEKGADTGLGQRSFTGPVAWLGDAAHPPCSESLPRARARETPCPHPPCTVPPLPSPFGLILHLERADPPPALFLPSTPVWRRRLRKGTERVDRERSVGRLASRVVVVVHLLPSFSSQHRRTVDPRLRPGQLQ